MQLFRHLYTYTSIGVTTLLEAALKISKQGPISPVLIEIVAHLERSLNNMHTGNAKVLHSRASDPLWPSRGLLADGLPCFHPKKIWFLGGKDGTVAFHWNVDLLPREPDSSIPVSCAKASILYHLGSDVFNVSLFLVTSWLHSQLTCRLFSIAFPS